MSYPPGVARTFSSMVNVAVDVGVMNYSTVEYPRPPRRSPVSVCHEGDCSRQAVTGGSAVMFRITKGGEIEMVVLPERKLSCVPSGVRAGITSVCSERSFQRPALAGLSAVVDLANRKSVARVVLNYAPDWAPAAVPPCA